MIMVVRVYVLKSGCVVVGDDGLIHIFVVEQ